MRPLPRLAVALPLLGLLLVLSAAAAATPVSVTFTGVMAGNALDILGAFGPARTDLAGEAMATTISLDTTLPYIASGSDDLYTDAAPGTGAITISITIGGVTLTQSSSYAGVLEAIGTGADTTSFGEASNAPGDLLGYGIASSTAWSAGMMDTSSTFETLLAADDPDQVQYLQIDTGPERWEDLLFTATDPQIIAEPAGACLLPLALLVLGLLRRRPLGACRSARQFC